ncbi:type II secretion system minor pseudopilin GspI [Kaarinaea lacus]
MVKRGRQTGFTLIEVIVALGIIATAMAAVMMTVSANVRNATGLKERTLAHWVAMNKMAELHIANDREWPSIKKTTGTSLMAEHEWHWEQEVEKTPVEKIRKVYIRVRVDEDDEYPIITLVGYVQQPPS